MPHEKYAYMSSNTRKTLRGVIRAHCEWQRGTETDRSQVTEPAFPYHTHSGTFLRGMANEVTALQWDFLFSLRTNDSFIFCQFTKVNSIMLNLRDIPPWQNEGDKTRGKKTRKRRC